MNARNRFRGHICQLIWRAHEQCTNNSFGFYPIMWQSTSICFLVSCKTVFDALWVATLFSQCIGIHSFIGYANSSMSSLDTSKAQHFFFFFFYQILMSSIRWENTQTMGEEETKWWKLPFKKKGETKCINCHFYLYVIKKTLKE